MANLIDYNGDSKVIKQICYLLNNVISKVTDVKVDGNSVLDERGVANITSMKLGTDHDKAFYGDMGLEAYEHAQIASGNPHNVTAADIGLDNIQDQLKAVMQAIGAEGYWQTHNNEDIVTENGDEIIFRTPVNILAYH